MCNSALTTTAVGTIGMQHHPLPVAAALHGHYCVTGQQLEKTKTDQRFDPKSSLAIQWCFGVGLRELGELAGSYSTSLLPRVMNPLLSLGASSLLSHLSVLPTSGGHNCANGHNCVTI